jgi:hypothetical protein
MTYDEWLKLNPGKGLLAYVVEHPQEVTIDLSKPLTYEDIEEVFRLAEERDKARKNEIIEYVSICRVCGELRGWHTKCKCYKL